MNEEFMRVLIRECYGEAALSPDPSTQIGAIILSRSNYPWYGTISHNRPVCGWEMTEADWETKSRKYLVVEHAERNAIYKAARAGLPLAFSTMVASWAACADCARAIVEVGITTLIRHVPPSDDASDRWMSSVEIGDKILVAGGVEIINVEGLISGAPGILRGGDLFEPAGVLL